MIEVSEKATLIPQKVRNESNITVISKSSYVLSPLFLGGLGEGTVKIVKAWQNAVAEEQAQEASCVGHEVVESIFVVLLLHLVAPVCKEKS